MWKDAEDYSSHTPGLCCMQVDLPHDGPFLFTSDQFHVKENYTRQIPQGESHLTDISLQKASCGTL